LIGNLGSFYQLLLIEFCQESFNLKKSDEFLSLMANHTQVNLNMDPGGLYHPQKWVQFSVLP
jgi:hypothetical protein